ncbi:hypothetical protein FOCC_FOCC015648 [Frankliniella occidentalis]|nr:hypothetical protein FOCC_FOCC015648 [Frankliniella occidentalis]
MSHPKKVARLLHPRSHRQQQVPLRKRGLGRPKKEAKAGLATTAKPEDTFLATIPKELKGFDGVAHLAKDECKNCRVYIGKCVLKPCGHALYCKKCVNELRQDSIQMKRPSKCYMNGCYSIVTDWMTLINVSA